MKYVIAFYGKNGMGYAKSLDDSTDCIDEAMWFDTRQEAECWIPDLENEWEGTKFRVVEVEV